MGEKVRIDVNERGWVDISKLHHINDKVQWWVAKITGLDDKYKYKREFINNFERSTKGRKITYILPRYLKEYEGEIIEIRGGTWSNPNRRSYWRILQVTDEFAEFEELTEKEIEKILREKEAEVIPEELREKIYSLVDEYGYNTVKKALMEVRE